jgi:hypothetical protein
MEQPERRRRERWVSGFFFCFLEGGDVRLCSCLLLSGVLLLARGAEEYTRLESSGGAGGSFCRRDVLED